MTGTARSSGGLDPRRRRLVFRAWHRGIREMDLILGKFADACVDELTDAELDAFERLMEMPDPEVYAWIAGGQPVPNSFDTDLLRRLRAFHLGVGTSEQT